MSWGHSCIQIAKYCVQVIVLIMGGLSTIIQVSFVGAVIISNQIHIAAITSENQLMGGP